MIGHTVGAGESSLIEAPKTSFGFAKTNPLKADYRVVFHVSHPPVGMRTTLTVRAVPNEEPAHGGRGH
jgi:hypothetical protein